MTVLDRNLLLVILREDFNLVNYQCNLSRALPVHSDKHPS